MTAKNKAKEKLCTKVMIVNELLKIMEMQNVPMDLVSPIIR